MENPVYFVFALFILAAVGMPIAFAITVTALLMFLAVGNLKMMAVAQNMVGGVDSFILMAVPLFILAGKVMNSGKVTDRIFSFASALVGHIKGGLGHVNILGSLIFAGISGSAVADAAGLGEVEIKAMQARGYDARFSAAITAASSVIGPIFPPSVPMVIYGGLTGVSVARLFLGGAIPGILMTIFLMAATYIMAVRRNFPREPRPTLVGLARSFREAFFAILSPVIVLGAIVTGITTATEAAVIAVLYSMLLGFCYRTLRPSDLPRLFVETGVETGVMMLIVSAVGIFSWILTYLMVPQAMMDFIFSYTKSPAVVIALLVVLLLILGCFMNPTPGLVVSVPFILPPGGGIGNRSRASRSAHGAGPRDRSSDAAGGALRLHRGEDRQAGRQHRLPGVRALHHRSGVGLFARGLRPAGGSPGA